VQLKHVVIMSGKSTDAVVGSPIPISLAAISNGLEEERPNAEAAPRRTPISAFVR